MADNKDQTPTPTFDDVFGGVPVDPNVHTARSRLAHHPEILEEETRRLRLNQDDTNKDFNQGRMYEETVTRNVQYNRLGENEIDLNRGDMSRAGRQLYLNRLAARLDGAPQGEAGTPTAGSTATAMATTTATAMATTTTPTGEAGYGGGGGRGGGGPGGRGRGGRGRGRGGPGRGTGDGRGGGRDDARRHQAGRGRGDDDGRGPDPARGSRERVLLRNPVSVQAMQDGIVDKGVYGRYANEIILLADWASHNQSDWFTPFGLKKYGVL